MRHLVWKAHEVLESVLYVSPVLYTTIVFIGLMLGGMTLLAMGVFGLCVSSEIVSRLISFVCISGGIFFLLLFTVEVNPD